MEISFHGCNFPSFFTGVSYFSRVGSEIFSRAVPSFHGFKTENFHGLAHFFHGEKKTLRIGGIYVNCLDNQGFFNILLENQDFF